MVFCNICGTRSGSKYPYCPGCGAPLLDLSFPEDSAMWREPCPANGLKPAVSGPLPAKKISVAVLLALLFGPFGLLYSTLFGAFSMLLGWCLLVLSTCDDWVGDQLMATLIAWPICIAWAAYAARSFNLDRR